MLSCMLRLLFLAIFSLTAFAGGIQKTAKLEDLPQTVDELFALKDAKPLKKRVLVQTVDGKKIRGYFVRFAGDILVLHDTPKRWAYPVTKLVSVRQIETLQVHRKRGKIRLAMVATTGVYLALVVPGTLAMFAYATPPYLVAITVLGMVDAHPSYHTVRITP